FFPAEDGIRDFRVTGVQTCALPILTDPDRLLARSHVTQYADLVITEAPVFTADAARSWTDAVAVRGDRIVALGAANVKELIGPQIGRASRRESGALSMRGNAGRPAE